MNATTQSVKANKAVQAEQEFAKLLAAAQVRGFYGTATLTMSLQDGHIQHLKLATERMVK